MDALLTEPAAPARAPAKPVRRLLLKNLTPPEWAKVVAFLRLAQDRLRLDWEVAAEGDAHVVLYGGGEADTITGLVHEPVLRAHLVDRASEPADLQRPLAYDAFLGLLLQAEALLLRAPAHAPARAAKPPPASAPAHAPTPAPRRAAPPPPPLKPGQTYRLLRWPRMELLQGHRHHVRIATFLSTRAMRIDELVFLSNVDEATCVRLVQRLHQAQLLSVQAVDPAAAPRPARGRGPQPGHGLLGRIRRAFGLGGGAR